jgi:hypothetical protein
MTTQEYGGVRFLAVKPGRGGATINARTCGGCSVNYGTILQYPTRRLVNDEDPEKNEVTPFEIGHGQRSGHIDGPDIFWTDGIEVALQMNIPTGMEAILTAKHGCFYLIILSQDHDCLVIIGITTGKTILQLPDVIKRNRNDHDGDTPNTILGSEICVGPVEDAGNGLKLMRSPEHFKDEKLFIWIHNRVTRVCTDVLEEFMSIVNRGC